MAKWRIAEHDYQGDDEGELTFAEGDKILVLDDSTEGWWKGRVGDREGLFPVNYTEPCDPPEEAPAARPLPEPAAAGSRPLPAAPGGASALKDDEEEVEEEVEVEVEVEEDADLSEVEESGGEEEPKKEAPKAAAGAAASSPKKEADPGALKATMKAKNATKRKKPTQKLFVAQAEAEADEAEQSIQTLVDDDPEDPEFEAERKISVAKASGVFADQLRYKAEEVSAQGTAGLTSLKKLQSFIKVLVQAEEKSARAINASLEAELKSESEDGMGDLAKAWADAQRCLIAAYKRRLASLATIQSDVVEKIGELHAELEGKWKIVRKIEATATKEMMSLLETVDKKKATTTKAIHNTMAREEADALEKQGKKKSFLAGLKDKMQGADKLRTKAYKASQEYEAAIAAANKHQVEYLGTIVPNILQQMETLEKQRITQTAALLSKFGELLGESAAQLPKLYAKIGERAGRVESEKTIFKFAKKLLKADEEKAEPVVPKIRTRKYSVPESPSDIQAGNWKSALPKSAAGGAAPAAAAAADDGGD